MTFLEAGDNVTFYVMDNCIHTESHGLTGLCARCEDLLHAQQHAEREPGCFACKVDTVGLQFTFGKANFKGPTIGERQEKQYAEAKRDGVDIAPVPKTWS